jgi:hypothetical protein
MAARALLLIVVALTSACGVKLDPLPPLREEPPAAQPSPRPSPS